MAAPSGGPLYKSLTLMFQKEVGERIVAAPGSRTYGRLSVLSQFCCDTHIHFDLPPRAFIPAPKVTSCVVGLTPKSPPENAPALRSIEQVTAAAFGQRRKMLRASLKSLIPNPQALLESVQIDPTSRAESLSVDDFCRLARAMEESSPRSKG